MAGVRRRSGERRVGHTGTLDPFATGLLVVLLGRATRLARFVEQQPKQYAAVAVLGVETTTDDGTGEPLARGAAGPMPTSAEIEQAVGRLTDVQEQVPPAFSAKKVGGERSYRLARQGAAPELPPVPVTVYAAECVEWEPPRLTFRCTVSAGTYVRALARDLGRGLRVGAYLEALRRERIGDFRVADAVPLADLLAAEVDRWTVLPPDRVLGHLDAVDLTADEATAVALGRTIPRDARCGAADGAMVRLRAEGRVVAVGEVTAEGIRPRVVLPMPGDVP